MDAVLVRIKRLLLAGRYQFSYKAEAEMLADDLREEDVVEAVVNAPAISKVPARRPLLRIRKIASEDTFYFLVSSKRWVPS